MHSAGLVYDNSSYVVLRMVTSAAPAWSRPCHLRWPLRLRGLRAVQGVGSLRRRIGGPGMSKCPRCRVPYSDWFVLPDGRRYCYLCWDDQPARRVPPLRPAEHYAEGDRE
jgi:hypothetical protein